MDYFSHVNAYFEKLEKYFWWWGVGEGEAPPPTSVPGSTLRYYTYLLLYLPVPTILAFTPTLLACITLGHALAYIGIFM